MTGISSAIPDTLPSTATTSSSSSSSSGNNEPDTTSASNDSTSDESQSSPQSTTHHIIFIVHGMGRQLEEFGNYEPNVGYFVEHSKAVLQGYYHNLKTDVHIIPIEWHAKMHSMVDDR
ncbi:hypothetical protein BGW38_008550, partial [Lunasporangiospora selenospora]